MTGAGFAQTLVLGGLAQPEATRKQQQQAAVQVGMRVSTQGLEQRFNQSSVGFMRSLLEIGLGQMIAGECEPVVLPQFNGVYLTDCTRLVWAKAGVKMGVRWELQQGQIQASLSGLEQHDQQAAVIEGCMPAGALHLGDLGFFKLKRFQQWNEQGVYWLTRYKVGITLYTPSGVALDLVKLLTQAPAPVVMAVRVGHKEPVSAYLVAAPLPEAAAAQRQTRLAHDARRDQRPLSPRQIALAQWTIYLTNIPDLTFAQAHTLARTRWQIELLFKLWKSHGKVLTSRSADPIRQQCEGFAKLLGVLIAHWLLLVCGWQHHTLSPLDALRLVRSHVTGFMRAFTQPFLWPYLFIWLRDDLGRASPRSKRGKVPLAFQLWQNFDLVWP